MKHSWNIKQAPFHTYDISSVKLVCIHLQLLGPVRRVEDEEAQSERSLPPFLSELLRGRTTVSPNDARTVSQANSNEVMLEALSLPPRSEDLLLSVGLRVPRSTATMNKQFLSSVKEGLRKAYIQGRKRQLGISPDPGHRQARSIRKTAFPSDNVEVRVSYLRLCLTSELD